MARKTGNIGFGNLTSLRPVSTATNNTTINQSDNDKNDNDTSTNQYTDDNTKIMKITLNTFQRLKEHSRRYYNIETYDTIIRDLIDCYDKHNDTKWY